mmetsp:Transcript_27875/g.62900  ORF Transcript_27875/g.62900 Transcript_27875/m.62900 type:complete len:293 (+) Transcript_27875:207-1085(+)
MLRFTASLLPFVVTMLQPNLGLVLADNHEVEMNRATRNLRGKRSNNDKQELCFDLQKRKLGDFGRQTVSVPAENVRWFLKDQDVTRGACDFEDVEILSARQSKAIDFCAVIGGAKRGVAYDMSAPRFLRSYLFERGVDRGECIDEMKTGEMVTNTHQAQDLNEMKPLCFDLRRGKFGGYGFQTVELPAAFARYFLRDDNVTSRPCDESGRLSRQEKTLVNFCVHKGRSSAGEEYILKAPDFLDDYLFDKNGVERGECSSSEAGKIIARYVPDFKMEMNTAVASSKRANPMMP